MEKRTLCVLIATCALIACGGSPAHEEPAAEPMAEETASEPMAESYPDPEPAVATEVQEFVSAWVGERAEDGVYDLPPRGDQDVAGTMADFHTVHQKDEDTYYVCVDFQDGDNLYDVDFFVDRTEGGLVLADHYLHKVNGEAIE